jgi:predicted enzyme related to lactoylglutathione lyase
MAAPVVHFEIVGRDAERLRSYFAALFGWRYLVVGHFADPEGDLLGVAGPR